MGNGLFPGLGPSGGAGPAGVGAASAGEEAGGGVGGAFAGGPGLEGGEGEAGAGGVRSPTPGVGSEAGCPDGREATVHGWGPCALGPATAQEAVPPRRATGRSGPSDRRSWPAPRPGGAPEPMQCWPACFQPSGNRAERRWPTGYRSGRPRPGFLPCSLPRCGTPHNPQTLNKYPSLILR